MPLVVIGWSLIGASTTVLVIKVLVNSGIITR